MDLESLESFLEVEKHKNFTKAAESLFCTQAAVSMRIKRLETALECGLFKRCGRRVELTREGEIFLPYARQMVNTWKSASEHLLQTRLMEESEIRITSSSTPGTYIIPSLIYLFRQSYPYITVINHIQYTRSAISDVIGGNFSLGIISQPASVGTDVLCCEPLMEDPLVLVVHPQHPWVEKRGILFKEITENLQTLSSIQFFPNGGQLAQMGNDIRSHTGKIRPCLINILLMDTDRQIPFLIDAVVGAADLG